MSRAGKSTSPVVVIGAGPYGLAVAAHLRARRVPLRAFGTVMDGWRAHMPSGMFLKSTPSASNIGAASPGSTLADFCRAIGREPLSGHHPIPIDVFIDYGRWFQARQVPELEPDRVTMVEREANGFVLGLEGGEELSASEVVVASGITPFAYVPPELTGLAPDGLSPTAALSHSAHHHDLSAFVGRHVAVVGAGQSALETAALLHERGARASVLVRGERVVFATRPPNIDHQGLGTPLKPESPLGPGWSHFALSNAAGLVRHLPLERRRWLVANILGPSGAWWLRERVDGRVAIHVRQRIMSAASDGRGVTLQLATEGGPRELTVDHVIAATGYRVDLDTLMLLAPALRAALRRSDRAPRLTASFESSVPGLYFTGLTAAATFGPLMRFVAGTAFAARRVCAAVAERRGAG